MRAVVVSLALLPAVFSLSSPLVASRDATLTAPGTAELEKTPVKYDSVTGRRIGRPASTKPKKKNLKPKPKPAVPDDAVTNEDVPATPKMVPSDKDNLKALSKSLAPAATDCDGQLSALVLEAGPSDGAAANVHTLFGKYMKHYRSNSPPTARSDAGATGAAANEDRFRAHMQKAIKMWQDKVEYLNAKIQACNAMTKTLGEDYDEDSLTDLENKLFGQFKTAAEIDAEELEQFEKDERAAETTTVD